MSEVRAKVDSRKKDRTEHASVDCFSENAVSGKTVSIDLRRRRKLCKTEKPGDEWFISRFS